MRASERKRESELLWCVWVRGERETQRERERERERGKKKFVRVYSVIELKCCSISWVGPVFV